MRCPECSSTSNKVLETRLSKDRNLLRRRRQCNGCETRFSTQEELVRGDLMIIKSSGRKEDFNIQKVREGLQLALRKRPVGDDAINEAVENIKSRVSDRLDREVSSHEIGEMVMMELKGLDEVAYVRFASVYREFKDASEFIETIQSMQASDYDSDK
ncbi:transcriptional regulator NrdR [Lentisphaera profundi]|uniref:Transcriptional repressor NrdR n=1 Tax=Lentisphaera profundi TaxID=1658616 RepID=A0ABY7VX85_9BACT|nr:transcriptional regulator NrdR [Lentisphaera profundi]WDE97810.1 transcriptional regulator NrdR [Lentisphaera profundi]